MTRASVGVAAAVMVAVLTCFGCASSATTERRRDELSELITKLDLTQVGEVLCSERSGEIGPSSGLLEVVVIGDTANASSVARYLDESGFRIIENPSSAGGQGYGVAVNIRTYDSHSPQDQETLERFEGIGCSIPAEGVVTVQFAENGTTTLP